MGRGRALAALSAVALTALLALTGCGKLAAQPGSGTAGSSAAASTVTSAPTATGSASDDSAALNGISQDLDSAGSANTEADSNAAAGDQAGATGDEP